MSAEKTRVSMTACPRCQCHLVRLFVCNCGSCHDDYCVNCGRFTKFAGDFHVKLSELDVVCSAGAVMHEHDPAERAEVTRKYFEKAKKSGNWAPGN